MEYLRNIEQARFFSVFSAMLQVVLSIPKQQVRPAAGH
jgi:hypothetical protein